jgi:hypothetical protein
MLSTIANYTCYSPEKGWHNPTPLNLKEEGKMLKYSIETITPEIAMEYLTKTGINARPMRATVVHEYTNIMKNGKWRLNGESIVISKNNIVLDGGHRLRACINSGCSFQSVIVRNVEDDYFATIDTGGIRNRSDILSLMGYENSKKLASVLRAIAIWFYHDWEEFLMHSVTGVNSHVLLDNETTKELIIDLNQTFAQVNLTRIDPKFLKLGQGFSIFVSWYFVNFAPDKALLQYHDFHEILASGVRLAGDSIIYYLREELLQPSVTSSITIISPRERARLYCLAIKTIIETGTHRMAKKRWKSIIRKSRMDFPAFENFNIMFSFPKALMFHSVNKYKWHNKIHYSSTTLSNDFIEVLKKTKTMAL